MLDQSNPAGHTEVDSAGTKSTVYLVYKVPRSRKAAARNFYGKRH
jgi:hypothetical protein